MKRTLALAALMLLPVAGRAQTPPTKVPAAPASTPAAAPDLVTLKGETFKNPRVMSAEPDGITYAHSKGVAKIPFADLPEAIRKQYGYDPRKAAAHAAADDAAQERLFQENQTRLNNATELQGAQLDRMNRDHEKRVVAEKQAHQMAVLREQISGRAFPVKASVLSVTGDGTLAFVRTKISLYEWGEQSSEPIFIAGLGGLVDGDFWEGTVFPSSGTYNYTSARGSSKTVRAVGINPDIAARLSFSAR